MGPYAGENEMAQAEDPLALIPMLRSLDEDLQLLREVTESLNKRIAPILVHREEGMIRGDMITVEEANPTMSDLSLKVAGMQKSVRQTRAQISSIISQVHL